MNNGGYIYIVYTKTVDSVLVYTKTIVHLSVSG